MIEMSLDFSKKQDNQQIKGKVNDIHAFMQEIGDKILEYAVDNLNSSGTSNTGRLAQSGHVEYDKSTFEVSVIFDAPYSGPVEFGTRPHTAPLGVSLPHVVLKRGKKKGIIRITRVPNSKTNPLDWWAWRRGHRVGVQTRYGVHIALGWGVWLKIKNKGSDPHPYLRPAIRKGMSKIHGILKRRSLIQ